LKYFNHDQLNETHIVVTRKRYQSKKHKAKCSLRNTSAVSCISKHDVQDIRAFLKNERGSKFKDILVDYNEKLDSGINIQSPFCLLYKYC